MGEEEKPRYEEWIDKSLAFARLVLKIPVIVVTIVTAAMGSWLAFWFVVRFTVWIYHHAGLDKPWN
jgi:hypothetical protein